MFWYIGIIYYLCRMKITERDVIVYREIYYETVKPMIKAGKTEEDIENALKYICEEFNISVEYYKALSHIDLMQRISSFKSDNIKLMSGEEYVNLRNVENLPELKCPRRTEQKI